MEKETMIANVRKMMQYADEKMKGVVNEDVCLTLERDPYHYIKFAFYPNKQGSCIEFGSWGGTYERMFADVRPNMVAAVVANMCTHTKKFLPTSHEAT